MDKTMKLKKEKFERNLLGIIGVLFVILIVLFSQQDKFEPAVPEFEFDKKFEVVYLGDKFNEDYLEILTKDDFINKEKGIFDVEKYILIDDSYLDDKDISTEFLNELVSDGHSVIFIGDNVNPEKVIEKFLEFGVAVVPIEAPQDIFYHGYGITYNEYDEVHIPLFFATVDDSGLKEIEGIIHDLIYTHLEFKK